MRVVAINICDNGSTGTIMLDILDGVKGDTCAYVSHKYTSRENVRLMHSSLSYKVHKLLGQYFGLDEWGSYFATRKMVRELKKMKPDILHLHNIHSYSVNYKVLFDYIKKSGVKVVWTLHDCWSMTGGCPYFDQNGCNGYLTDCKDCRYPKDAGIMTGVNATAKHLASKKKAFLGVEDMTIVTPSKWLYDLVKKSYLKDYDIRVINNGVNLAKFKNSDNGRFNDVVNKNKKILLGVGNPFNERKGYSDFLKLNEKLNDEYQVVMIGLSQEQIENLPDGIVGLHRTSSQEELANLYSIAYVYLNLTYDDNFPTVNMEALSCGTPVICYKTGGATEMLDDTDSICVDKGDIDGVVKALDEVDSLRENSEEFATRTHAKYTTSRMVENYINLYEEKLSK